MIVPIIRRHCPVSSSKRHWQRWVRATTYLFMTLVVLESLEHTCKDAKKAGERKIIMKKYVLLHLEFLNLHFFDSTFIFRSLRSSPFGSLIGFAPCIFYSKFKNIIHFSEIPFILTLQSMKIWSNIFLRWCYQRSFKLAIVISHLFTIR